MNVRTLINKSATAAAFAAMTLFAGACSHQKATGDYGHVDTTSANMTSSNTSDTAVNNNGDVTTAPVATVNTTYATPIPGPAKVDSDGNAYTSSSAPGTGNASVVGTNTNVNIVPKKVSGSSAVTYTEAQTTPVVVTETPAPIVTTPTVTETTVTPVITETTTTTETTPMTSSVTEQTTTTDTTTTSSTTTHKRMRKD